VHTHSPYAQRGGGARGSDSLRPDRPGDESVGKSSIGPFALIGGDDIGKASWPPCPSLARPRCSWPHCVFTIARPPGPLVRRAVMCEYCPHGGTGPRALWRAGADRAEAIDALDQPLRNVYGPPAATGTRRAVAHHPHETEAPRPKHRAPTRSTTPVQQRPLIRIAQLLKKVMLRTSRRRFGHQPGRLRKDTPASPSVDAAIILWFAQVGADICWRTANTESIKRRHRGCSTLNFSDAQRRQGTRSAILSFSNRVCTSRVPRRSSSPLGHVSRGQGANIPVILTDRAVDSRHVLSTNRSSDLLHQGGQARRRWLVKDYAASRPVEHRRTAGPHRSAPATTCKNGFGDVHRRSATSRSLPRYGGDFTRAGGKQSWSIPEGQPKIDVLFAHNDDIGLGALEASRPAGKVPRKDIKIIPIARSGRYAGTRRRDISPSSRNAAHCSAHLYGSGEEGQ